jgi:hypothetical protein
MRHYEIAQLVQSQRCQMLMRRKRVLSFRIIQNQL